MSKLVWDSLERRNRGKASQYFELELDLLEELEHKEVNVIKFVAGVERKAYEIKLEEFKKLGSLNLHSKDGHQISIPLSLCKIETYSSFQQYINDNLDSPVWQHIIDKEIDSGFDEALLSLISPEYIEDSIPF